MKIKTLVSYTVIAAFMGGAGISESYASVADKLAAMREGKPVPQASQPVQESKPVGQMSPAQKLAVMRGGKTQPSVEEQRQKQQAEDLAKQQAAQQQQLQEQRAKAEKKAKKKEELAMLRDRMHATKRTASVKFMEEQLNDLYPNRKTDAIQAKDLMDPQNAARTISWLRGRYFSKGEPMDVDPDMFEEMFRKLYIDVKKAEKPRM